MSYQQSKGVVLTKTNGKCREWLNQRNKEDKSDSDQHIAKMTVPNHYLLSLHENDLNSSFNYHRTVGWIKKQKLSICCLQKADPSTSMCGNKVKRWERIVQANGKGKGASVAILISDNTDFDMKITKTDEEGHHILIKGSIHKEEITITNVYALNTRYLVM